ncbi:MAG: flagellar basal-body rod protein FlgF [Pseudomonadota bacterium]
MDTTAYVALSRMDVLQRRMNMVASNLANLTTNGYRAEALRFGQFLEGTDNGPDVSFVSPQESYRDYSEGPIEVTENAFDFAISGDGFFSVLTPSGVRYTRDGHFELNEVGEIVSSGGFPLVDDGGAPIVVPQGGRDIVVAEDGTITSDGAVLGRLTTSQFGSPQELIFEGGGLFMSQQGPIITGESKIIQGALERSNVQPLLEITRMMETVRAFEGTQRLIDVDNDMERKVIERALDLRG